MKNRDAWWAKHEPSCVTEWTCTFGKCPNVEKKRQYNFLMCLYHAENNKEFENRFIESLDQKEVTPGLRFFLNYSINQLDTFVTLPPAKNPKIIHQENNNRQTLNGYLNGGHGNSKSNNSNRAGRRETWGR